MPGTKIIQQIDELKGLKFGACKSDGLSLSIKKIP